MKPEIILRLEKELQVELKELQYGDILSKTNRNNFLQNDNNEIIGLNLNNNDIIDINFLQDFVRLSFLNLSSNNINDISILNNLKGLTEVDLSNNCIKHIKDLNEIFDLVNINLSFNQISNISSLENLKSITNMNLSYNQILDISSLENLKSLASINLRSNQISDISSFENLKSLIRIDLSSNQISDISSLENLNSLTSINLSSNEISDISIFETLTALTNIKLTANKISDISFLENLTTLTEIDLSINQISDISSLKNLTALTTINLSSNKISNISVLENFSNISILYLGQNQIFDLNLIKKLTNLKSLDFSYNQISDISFLKNLKNLKNLYLNGITEVDYNLLSDLTSLTTLFLGSNEISNISFLKKLKKIDYLYLSYNNIEDISILKELTTISDLFLNRNKIKDISILENLKSIRRLEVCNNQILDIEQFQVLFNIPKLNIKASNNPCFENYDLEKDKNNYDTILNILNKLIEEKQEYILPAKVLLLGNSESGKSTLLDYLLQNKETRVIKDKPTSTHVVQIETYPKRLKKNEIPKVVFYDFGGQDYYHGLYKAFLSNNSINLLLWNSDYDKNQIRKDRTGLLTRDYNRDYWLHQLKFQYTNNIVNSILKVKEEPVLLVQTKADIESHFRKTYKGDCEILNIKNEFYLSLNQLAINDSRSLEISLRYFEETLQEQIKLKQIIKNEPVWYKDFLNYILRANNKTFTPLSEVAIEYKRASDPNNFLLPEVLREIAQTGLILYYKDDDDLKDIVWLDPSKTIQNIHKSILSRKNIINRKGIVEKDDFDKLVDQKLTKLLVNQKVIFFDSFDNKYIIPGYLPLTEEDDKIYELLTFDFIDSNFILKFKYFIPLGLINQLICFYGKNKNKKYYWRDQLLFTIDSSKILIKLDFTNLEIIVSIKSNDDNKKIDILEQKIFKDILDLYWDKNIKEKTFEKNEINEGINIENLIDGKLKAKVYHEKDDDLFNSPEDLYISIDNKNFVHHKTLDSKEKTINKIMSFGLDSRKEIQNGKELEIRIIDETKTAEIASGIYKNFTNNDNTKKMKRIFISYAKENKKEVNEFQKQIAPFKLTKEVETWHCSELELGENWDSKIKNKFYEADIILYFISTDFFSTPYILDEEVKRGIERDKDPNDNVVLVPIILEKIHWEDLLGKYTSNFKGIPINLYDKASNAWYDIVDELKKQHFRKIDKDSTSGILGQSKEKMKAQEDILNRKL